MSERAHVVVRVAGGGGRMAICVEAAAAVGAVGADDVACLFLTITITSVMIKTAVPSKIKRMRQYFGVR